MNTYRVGFIGCGGIARAHAMGYHGANNAHIEFVAGSDLNPDGEKAQRLASEYGITLYGSHQEMLANEKIDLISICTWPKGHCEATLAAAEYGARGIMCEKPMAINLEEADQMIAACDASGSTLAIGHAHRFSPQAEMARSLIQKGEIGTVSLIWGHCSLDLMNNGTHVIDLVNYLNGDVEAAWVMGQIDRQKNMSGRGNHPDMVVEDMAVGRVGYKNGVVGLIELGERAHQAYQFHVIGSDGIIDVNATDGPALKVLSGYRQRGWYAPELPEVFSFQSELEELVEAVEGKKQHRSSARHGRAALEIIMGIFESSARRSVVEFPVDVRDFPLERMIAEGMLR